MRQAGRYLPEYRATRAKAGSFLKLCMNPELACEVTLQPLERFALDAAILFSDILTIPHAMNVGLEFEAGEGPKIARPVRTPADIDRLPIPDPEGELRYVMDAVRTHPPRAQGPRAADRLRRQPVDRGHLRGRGRKQQGLPAHQGHAVRRARRAAPPARQVITRATLAYLNAQVAAGAQAVMVFDTWGGALTPARLPRVLAALPAAHRRRRDARERGPARARHPLHQGRRAVARRHGRHGRDALGVDWTTDLADARTA